VQRPESAGMRMASTNTAVNPLFFVDSGVVIARNKQ
jgi:hypothetical protein